VQRIIISTESVDYRLILGNVLREHVVWLPVLGYGLRDGRGCDDFAEGFRVCFGADVEGSGLSTGPVS
jgi:hypothetical protein